jgi:integrase
LTALVLFCAAPKSSADPKARDRRPTAEELEVIRAYWEQAKRRNATIPMWTLVLFQIATAMRISETCRIRCREHDEENRTDERISPIKSTPSATCSREPWIAAASRICICTTFVTTV